MASWKTLKEYIPLAVHWDCEGDHDYNNDVVPYLTPSCLYLESGGRYVVDRVREDGILPSFQSGGYGNRYTARTSSEAEENYNKVFYLYYEGHGQLGRWRCGDEYIAVNVFWDADGTVTPTSFYLGEHHYIIPKRGVRQMYRMSSRKTDGSGMKFIVRATCKELRDYNREFALMLENGGVTVGRWYYEDADAVHGEKVIFSQLDTGAFDNIQVEFEMGVANVCARFQRAIDVTDFLREWNAERGIWLSPEAFEKRVRDGIIYPKDYYPVMIFDRDDAKVVPSVMQWGLERSWASGVIYNLRCDNLAVKNTFEKIKGNRCVIPCGGFYEYEKSGKKAIGDYLFKYDGQEKMYLAGLYEPTDSGNKYSIITTQPNACVDIHDRMPVILQRGECKAWLSGELGFEQISDRRHISLMKTAV